MANISDLIEAFLLDTMGSNEKLTLSRNELANYFSCAPSQINYVLTTRFTPERGYVIESRRGGGGSITVVRLSQTPEEAYGGIMDDDGMQSGISFAKARQLLDRMCRDELITEREEELLATVLSDKALIAPTVIKDRLRLSILRAALVRLIKINENESSDSD